MNYYSNQPCKGHNYYKVKCSRGKNNSDGSYSGRSNGSDSHLSYSEERKASNSNTSYSNDRGACGSNASYSRGSNSSYSRTDNDSVSSVLPYSWSERKHESCSKPRYSNDFDEAEWTFCNKKKKDNCKSYKR